MISALASEEQAKLFRVNRPATATPNRKGIILSKSFR